MGDADREAQANVLSERDANAGARAKPHRARLIRGSVTDISEYRRAMHALTSPGKLSRQERQNLETTAARLRDKLEFGPERKLGALKIPGRSRPDRRAFERWLVMASERSSFVPNNFGFWCLASHHGNNAVPSLAASRRVDLVSIGFSPQFMSEAIKNADDPKSIKATEFSPAQFLSAATGIQLGRVEGALELLRNEEVAQFPNRKGSAYLSNQELDRCITACRKWELYEEPGAANSDAIIQALFEEMNLRGIGKDEVERLAGVTAKALDTWNHTDKEKRSPPKLPTISAALEAVGLRLMAIPEANVAEILALVKRLKVLHRQNGALD